MKNYKELTTEELANLTDDEIQLYKNYICAEQGVGFSMVEPIEPKNELPDTDLVVYTLKGIEYLAFISLDEAKRVQDVLNDCKTAGKVCYGNYQKFFSKGITYDGGNKTSIESESVFSKEINDSIKGKVESLQAAKNKYKSDLSEYENYKIRIEKATKDFAGRIRQAKSVINKRKKFLEIFINDYMSLADVDTAMQFFKKAYTISCEDEKYILNGISKNE